MEKHIDHSRQQIIPGHNQNAIDDARLVIIGNNALSELISIGAVCIGATANMLTPISGKPGTPPLFAESHDVFDIKDAIEELLSGIRVSAYGDLMAGLDILMDTGIDAIVDCSGDPDTIAITIELGSSLDIPTMIAAKDSAGFNILFDLEEVPVVEQNIDWGIGETFIAAGEIIHEFRAKISPRPSDCPPAPVVRYNALSRADLANRPNILQVGAGGIGGAAAFILASFAGSLHIMDGDTSEASNLARNPWLSGDDGFKAEAMRRAVQQLFPTLDFQAYNRYLESAEDDIPANLVIVVAAPDNWQARSLCSKISLDRGIPYANSGCSVDGAIAYLCIGDRKSTRLNSSHIPLSRMPSSA